MSSKRVRFELFVVSLSFAGLLCGCDSDATELKTIYRVTAAGRLDSVSEARQLVAKRDGVIDRVFVSEGDKVKAGQPIATIQCASAMASLSIAEAEVVAAQASLNHIAAPARDVDIAAAAALKEAQSARSSTAEAELQRLRPLLENNLVSKDEFDVADGEARHQSAMLQYQSSVLDRTRLGSRAEKIQVAKEQLAVAQSRMAGARVEVDDCTVASPIDGTALRTYRKAGEYSGASQGAVLADVADLSRMMVRAELDETDAGRVGVGDAADVWVNGQDNIYKGRIVNVAGITGRRTIRTDDPADRFDREVVEARIMLEEAGLPSIVNLRVVVGIH